MYQKTQGHRAFPEDSWRGQATPVPSHLVSKLPGNPYTLLGRTLPVVCNSLQSPWLTLSREQFKYCYGTTFVNILTLVNMWSSAYLVPSWTVWLSSQSAGQISERALSLLQSHGSSRLLLTKCRGASAGSPASHTDLHPFTSLPHVKLFPSFPPNRGCSATETGRSPLLSELASVGVFIVLSYIFAEPCGRFSSLLHWENVGRVLTYGFYLLKW